MEKIKKINKDQILRDISIIQNIPIPKGKIPLWLKLTSSKEMIAKMTFCAMKQIVIHEISKQMNE